MTVQELIDQLNKIENKNVSINVWLNDIWDSEEYHACDRLDIVHIDTLCEGKIDICAEPPFWYHIANQFLHQNYFVVIVEGKEVGRLRGYYYSIFSDHKMCEENLIYSSDDDDNMWFDKYEEAVKEAKKYIDAVLKH